MLVLQTTMLCVNHPALVSGLAWCINPADVFTRMHIRAGKHLTGKREKSLHVWQRENKSSRGEFCSRIRDSYLSPVAGLPFGASSTSAAPLLAGFGGQMLAVFFWDGAAWPSHTAHLTGLETFSTGRWALQCGKKELNKNETVCFVVKFKLWMCTGQILKKIRCGFLCGIIQVK